MSAALCALAHTRTHAHRPGPGALDAPALRQPRRRNVSTALLGFPSRAPSSDSAN